MNIIFFALTAWAIKKVERQMQYSAPILQEANDKRQNELNKKKQR